MIRSRKNLAPAFTLIELIFVLAIMALIATIAIPSMSAFERGQRVGDTADQIIALSRWARTESIARGVAFRLNIDVAQGRYWLTMQNGASYENVLQDSQSGTLGLSSGANTTTTTQFADVGEEMGRQFQTPTSVSLTTTVVAQPDGQYVTFLPSGRCDPATISVNDSNGKSVLIGCLSATENYHILSDDEKLQMQSLSQPPPGAAAR